MSDEKKYQNWPDLVLYTKEFKEWIWKLFRKVHARIGHVEEELSKTKRNLLVDYRLTKNPIVEEGKIQYDLIETNKGELHGSIVFDSSSIQSAVWDDEITM